MNYFECISKEMQALHEVLASLLICIRSDLEVHSSAGQLLPEADPLSLLKIRFQLNKRGSGDNSSIRTRSSACALDPLKNDLSFHRQFAYRPSPVSSDMRPPYARHP